MNISFIECNSGKYKLIGKFMGRNLGKRKKGSNEGVRVVEILEPFDCDIVTKVQQVYKCYVFVYW